MLSLNNLNQLLMNDALMKLPNGCDESFVCNAPTMSNKDWPIQAECALCMCRAHKIILFVIDVKQHNEVPLRAVCKYMVQNENNQLEFHNRNIYFDMHFACWHNSANTFNLITVNIIDIAWCDAPVNGRFQNSWKHMHAHRINSTIILRKSCRLDDEQILFNRIDRMTSLCMRSINSENFCFIQNQIGFGWMSI